MGTDLTTAPPVTTAGGSSPVGRADAGPVAVTSIGAPPVLATVVTTVVPAIAASPPPEPTAPPTPLPPPTTSTTTAPAGEWRASRTNPDGSPVRYDPCRVLQYVTRLGQGPSFARTELDWAIGQIEAASGLDLQWVGDVEDPVSPAWPSDGPLHLGFATEDEFPMPAGMSGYGDSWTVDEGDGYRRYTGGRVVVRPDDGWTQGTASVNPLGLMFLHELGHVVGLAHVSSPDEVMTDKGNGTARALGAGDRAGLAAVGRPAGCK